ncbi:GNAT family N-acetyltransferase [Simiduia agarivorans]|uniref:GNAT family acetyltransferase n=1 Tax=Simiduia agarivorans (strain DSM 21679 / JCM 13881 / BCRC 17597 / SA1) TaxID=1117647 RepID=K4KMJ4_SIMAS|nr:GNAT family N-acetyltransferase [Simiduia agarivorans]AFU99308.1 GNAT family acetyltransferase [Simiduia agarivorans SA1 = DSM 21679]
MALFINEPTHFNAFSALNYAWISQFFEVEASDRKALDNPGDIVKAGGHIITQSDGQTVVGCCALLCNGERSFELAKMAVRQSHQGRGLANVLMQAAIGLAREQGALSIDLLTNSRLVPAVTLYRKFGFAELPAGCHPDYARCDLVMRLNLD